MGVTLVVIRRSGSDDSEDFGPSRLLDEKSPLDESDGVMTVGAPRPDDERQIRAVLEDRAAALRAKDASQYLSSFDPSVVKFDLAPPLQECGPSVLDPAGLQWWLDTWDGDISHELAGLTIAASGDVAFCHSLNHIKGTRTDGERQDMWTRSTLGLRKIGGVWKITHEHNSAPFYMDGSDRPALDLKP